jgi:pyrroline-5-carboxylate reductase
MINAMNILFIGGGKMMQAIAGGLISRGTPAATLSAIEPDAATRQIVSAMGIRAEENADAAMATIASTEIIILAVKPQVMCEAITPFAGKLNDQLVLSIAAGVRTRELSRWLHHKLIVRAMPNTPALIQVGISGLFADAAVDSARRARAESLLATVGKTIWVEDESLLDAVTAVSGSGPAYVFYAIEALEAAAIKLGIAPNAARLLAIETFRGAALLAAQSAESPSVLRANVTSKRGTTEAAIAKFNDENISQRWQAGVLAAAQRATELGDELGQIGQIGQIGQNGAQTSTAPLISKKG